MTSTPLRLCAAFAVVTAAALPLSAHAEPGPPVGSRCGFDTISNSGIPEDYTYTGLVYGGPVAAPGSIVSLTCSIHVGNTTHSGTAAVTETAGPSPSVVALEPRVITYWADPVDDVALCTEATVDDTAWYMTPDGGWTTDPDAQCYVSTTVTIPPDHLPPPPVDLGELPPPADKVVGYLVCIAFGGFCEGFVDAVTCDVFVAAAPGVPGVVDINSQGDVYLAGEPFWDCPPYDMF